MEPESVLQALYDIWDELPGLLGPAWADVYPELTALVVRLPTAQDPRERASLATAVLLAFRGHSEAERRLRVAIQAASRARGPIFRRAEAERRATGPVSARPDWSALVIGLQLLDQGRNHSHLQRRHMNVCVTEHGSETPLPKATILGVGQRYQLRLDIGPLSPDSVVENAERNPFPVESLPETQTGHWLDVVVVSDDFTVSPRRHGVFLPKSGASWVCDCIPGTDHVCNPDARRPHLFISMEAPQRPGHGRLRVGVYYGKNLLQSQLLTAHVAEMQQHGSGYSSTIDYTLTSTLAEVSFLPPRTLNILTNQNADGTHRVVINGAMDDVLAFRLTEGQMRGTVNAAREALRNVHFEEYGGQLGSLRQRRNLLDENNAKTTDQFIADLRRLAPLGWSLWTMLLEDHAEWWETLRAPSTIQVSRISGSAFMFPWALVYDIPLESYAQYTMCPLLERWTEMSAAINASSRRCPFEHVHANKNVLCPFGFWGFKHIIEQPASQPKDRNLPLEVRATNRPPVLVMGLSLQLDSRLTQQHVDAIKGRLPRFHVYDYDSLDQIKAALADSIEVVYFYCHGRREILPGTDQAIPYLELGRGERFQPQDITAWRAADWPPQHWRESSPLVFINGCHTAELTPELLVNFVDKFIAAYASGVIGTEIALEQGVASEAAEQFFGPFQGGEMSVGQALHQMRLHLLSKGNLLGLAYTPYCSTDLKLSGLAYPASADDLASLQG